MPNQKLSEILQKYNPICTTSYFTESHNRTHGLRGFPSSRHSSLAPTGGIARGLELLVWGCDYWKLHNEPTHLLPYNFFGCSRVELSSVWLYSLCGKWSRPTKWIQTQAPGCYSSMHQCSNHSAKLDIQYKHIQFIQVFHMLILSCLW